MIRIVLTADRRGGDPVRRPGELARGEYWSIVREGEEYILHYLSRRLVGREERVTLTERDVNAIVTGGAAVEQYLPG